MQVSWLWRALRTGIVTTRYPARPEPMPARWRGRAVLDPERCCVPATLPPCVAVCLPKALMVLSSEGADQARLRLDGAACIACGLCVTACPEGALQMRPDVELARPTRGAQITESVTRRSE